MAPPVHDELGRRAHQGATVQVEVLEARRGGDAVDERIDGRDLVGILLEAE